MTVSLELHVVELLCSRLCHDLISPVGAIANGVELIEEMGQSMADEAMSLIADSADQAARRLRLFRLAYGAAGNSGSFTAAEARTVLGAWFRGGRVRLDWPADVMPKPDDGLLKLALNLGLLAEEAMPHGGVVTIAAAGGGGEADGGGKPALSVTAEGPVLNLRDEVRLALDGALAQADLTPRSVQAYVTGRFAEQCGWRIAIDAKAPEALRFLLLRQAS
ncbi:histidine phosphotransferase family protein [Nitrospirillum sp. BR 11828]|uniref:histidine phosphotransferase family protein n=1 Tax=Nitrospirillum sp. BR 11828 TaxID=3104325 RepID=UPI002ACA6629|nr:histidine phosphotransferase family protein [Nitrospirillum sp. BR 11828]MDZ5646044.1 histidine phosphotransferase family protein [Nitrospirillum sp. BR 11828]